MKYEPRKIAAQQLGFTLIELMIVVAIIGILSTVAISAYQTYTIRGQVTEGFSLSANARTRIMDTYLITGEAPANRIEAGLGGVASDTAAKYVTGVDVDNGRIEVTFGNDAHALIENSTLTLTPYETGDGGVVWRCAGQDAPTDGDGNSMSTMGSSGSGSAAIYDAGDVDSNFLPSNCR